MAYPPNPHPRGSGGLQALRSDMIEGIATQGYGNTGFEHFHDGVDLVMPNAAMWHEHPPVHAPISGTVIAAGWDNANPAMGYGQKVEIQSAEGYRVMVGHLWDMYQIATPDRTDFQSKVEVGQQVWAGDTIGHEGSTGYSTGNHVHYRFRDPSGRSLDPSLGEPAFAGVGPLSYPTQTNVFYATDHDLGFGAGDNTNTQKWVAEPPPPGLMESRVLRSSNGQLLPNTGNHTIDPIPPGQPGTDPGGGGTPIPVSDCTGCPAGWQCQPCTNGHLPDGSVCAGPFVCVPTTGQGQNCVTIAGQQICTPSNPFGDIGATVQQAIMTLGLVLVGVVFIAAGLVSLTKEGPVNTVTAPLAAGGRAIIKTGAKVGALAA